MSSAAALATFTDPTGHGPFRTIFDALSVEAGVDGVRWLLQSRPARARLAQTVSRMLCEPAVPIRFRLQYAVAKPRRLRAGFDVTVRGTATGTTVTRAIRVTWQIRRGNLPVVLPVLPTPEVPESVAAPFRRLAVQDPDWAMSVWAWPFDPVFGQLAQLADPGYAGHLLSGEPGGERSGGQAPGYAVTPVRYIPEAAHVLRYDPLGGGRRVSSGSVFAKLYADPLLCALRREVIDSAAAVIAASSDAVRVPRPMGQTAERGVLLYPGVRGGSLAGYLERGRPEVGEILGTLGGALRALQTLGAHPGLPSQTLGLEMARTVHATRHLDGFAPVAGDRARRLLEIAAEAGDGIPGEQPMLAHGDLKAEHVLITSPARIALIDFDACSGAEPAVDLGRVLAEVRWALLASQSDARAEAQGQFLKGYMASGPVPPERLLRARVYELVAFIRIAMRYLKLWAPGWRAAAEGALVRAAEIARELE